MCGIFGVSELNKTTAPIVPYLAFTMEERGRDSWGFTDGTHVHKEMGHITRNLFVPKWPRLIGHCRMTSVGKVILENQHPFVFANDTKKVVGIHNGTLSNYTELNHKHDRDYDVDSKHIFAHLFEEKDIKEIRGSAAISYIDEKGNIIVGRSKSSNLYVAELSTGERVFASTRSDLEKSIRAGGGWVKKIEMPDADKLFIINGEEILKEIGEFEFGSSISSSSNSRCGGYNGWGHLAGANGAWSDDDEEEELGIWRRQARQRAGSRSSSTSGNKPVSIVVNGEEKVKDDLDIEVKYCYTCSEPRTRTEKAFCCMSCFRRMKLELQEESIEGHGAAEDNTTADIYNTFAVDVQ